MRLVSSEEAVASIRDGDTVFVHGGAARMRGRDPIGAEPQVIGPRAHRHRKGPGDLRLPSSCCDPRASQS